MNIKNFVLSYYKNATLDMHIHHVNNSSEAQNPHTHDYFQLYFVTSGSIAHFTSDSSTILLRGDMLIIPPKCVHYIDQSKTSSFYSFSFTADTLNKVNSKNKLAVDFLSSLSVNRQVPPKVVLTDEEFTRVETILKQTHHEFNNKTLAYEDVMRCYLAVLLTLFARKQIENQNFSQIKVSNGDNEQIKHCIEFLNQNYAESFSLKEMAQYSALSVSVFCKAFKQISGYTFNEYLHRTRINASKALIDSGVKITIASSLVGYKDFSTFYRNFKKIIGFSPEEYLKRIKQ